MPWREVSMMDQRRSLFGLRCRRERTGASCAGGSGFIRRPATSGSGAGLAAMGSLRDRSRRPHSSPARSDAAIEALVLAVRDAHPAWGARKIARCLERDGLEPPAPSTVHAILRRHGRIVPPAGGAAGLAALREAGAEPAVADGLQGLGAARPMAMRCHPLTVVDDHSRYRLCLQACADEQGDDGAEPSGDDLPSLRPAGGDLRRQRRALGRCLGSSAGHGSACGCSSSASTFCTAGPIIRRAAARTSASTARSKAEVFALRRFRDLAEVQRAFDRWRDVYNFERPHEALDQEVPASRYRPSPRAMPERLPAGRIRRARDRAHRLHHQGLCQLQGPTLESPASFLRRTPGHPAARKPMVDTASSSALTKSPTST